MAFSASGDLAAAGREEKNGMGNSNVAVEVAPDFSAAVLRAKELAGDEGVVCAWGSLYSLSELKNALGL